MDLISKIYLIDIVCGVGAASTIFLFFYAIMLICVFFIGLTDHLDFKSKPMKISYVVAGIALVLATFIPTKTAAYTMLSVHVPGNYATETGLDKKAVDVIKQKLDEIVKEKK